jgi:putative nucleotidyltransferase with HDIG domain
MASRLDILVSSIDTAATLPAVVPAVLKVCDNPASNAKDVAAAVSQDPVLAARLLRMANSAYFGLASKCSNVQNAVVRLGLKSVRNAVLGLSVSKFFDSPVDKDGYSRPNLWRHSVAVGIFNELLCGVVKLSGCRALAGEAFLVGLVHDLGIILEDQYKSKTFAKIPPLAFELKSHLHQVEKESLGFDHQDLGAAVLKKWKFPKELADVVGAHHKAGKPGAPPLVLLTALSEMLALLQNIGYADLRYIDKTQFGRLCKQLGLNARGLTTVREKFQDKYKQAAEMFDIADKRKSTPQQGYVIDTKETKRAAGDAS